MFSAPPPPWIVSVMFFIAFFLSCFELMVFRFCGYYTILAVKSQYREMAGYGQRIKKRSFPFGVP